MPHSLLLDIEELCGSQSVKEPGELTGLVEEGAPLVNGGAQAGSTHIKEAGLFNASIKHTKEGLLFLPLGQDFIVDESGEHLGLNEATQKRKVWLWLV